VRRLVHFLIALVRYRDVHYAKRLLARGFANLRMVGASLGAHYVRVRPWQDLGGVEASDTCERLDSDRQPAGFVRVNLVAYHLALPEVDGRTVVEVGTNEGYGAALFATRARAVHAYDVSAEAIARARQRHARPNVHFEVHDATRPFPIPDGTADVVFASEVIEHLADPPAFVDAAHRMLRDGGVLLLKTPNDAFNRWENRLNPYHLSPFDAGGLRKLLARRFRQVSIEGLVYRTEVVTEAEDRPSATPPETAPYRFGEPIEIDRVLVTRVRIVPERAPSTSGAHAEYLWARAVR